MALVHDNVHHFNELRKNSSSIQQFSNRRILIGQSGQIYGLGKRLGRGSFGVVYDAIKLIKNRNGDLRPSPQDKVPIVIKIMKNCN